MRRLRLALWGVGTLLAASSPVAIARGDAQEPAETWWWHRVGEVPVGVIRELTTTRADGTRRTEEFAELRPWTGSGEQVTKWGRYVEEDARGHVTWLKNERQDDERLVTSEGQRLDTLLKLTVTEHGKDPTTHDVPWPGDVYGPAGLVQLRRERGFAPGTRYTYLAWDFETWRVVSYEAHVEEAGQPLDGPGGAAATARLAVRPVSPAGATLLEWWADGACVRRWVAATGDASRVRVDKDTAIGRGAGVVAAYSVAELAKLRAGAPRVPRPGECTAVTWRLRLASGEWGPIELTGPEQKGKAATDGSWVVQVEAASLPKGGPTLPLKAPPDAQPGLEDGFWVGLDGAVIPEAAKAAVGGERNAARAVEKIVAAVADRLRVTPLNAGIATAPEAWRQREGDCLEHALCVVALCRATGIPARLAGGLRLVRSGLQYHAWAEVWLGHWLGVDAATPSRACDAARIRFGTAWLADNTTPEVALVNVGTVVRRLEAELMAATVGRLRLPAETARIQERVFEDPLWGVRLTLPPEWEFRGPEASVEAAIAVAHGKRGRRMNVRAGAVGLHETAWDLARSSGFDVENAAAVDVGGVTALVADMSPRGGSGGYAPRTAYVLDGETLFTVEYAGDKADGQQAFVALLENWRWLRRGGK